MENWIAPLFGIAVIGVVIVGMVLFFRKIGKDAERLKARVAQAHSAEARVIQVGRSLLQKHQGTTNIRLRLEVTPKDRPPYQTTVTWDVEQAAIPKVQEGKQVAVKIDVENPKIVYPRVGWAEFNWVYSEPENHSGKVK